MTRYLSIAFAAFSVFLVSLFGYAMTVGSDDIQKNAVRGKHIQKNAVKGSDIASGAVKSSDIRDGTIQTKDLGNEAVNATKIESGAVGTTELADAGVTTGKLSPELQKQLGRTHDVYVEINADGAEAVLAENGPLKIFARCLINDGGGDKLKVIATSTQSPWYSSLTFGTPLAANTEEIIIDSNAPAGVTAYGTFIDQFHMNTDGYYIGYDGDSLAPGINIFGNKCLVTGRLHSVSKN